MSRSHLGLTLVSLVTPGMIFLLSVTRVPHWHDGGVHKAVYKEEGTSEGPAKVYCMLMHRRGARKW